jgi:flagellar motor switch protein FliN/FliY
MADEPTPQPPQDPAPSESSKPAADSVAEAALRAAQEAIAGLAGDVASVAAPAPVAAPRGPDASAGASPMPLPSFDRGSLSGAPKGIDLLSDVNLHVKIELGRTRMLVEDVLRLADGAIVELDKLAGDPVDIYVNERHIAKGEVLVLNDNFCVRINEILPAADEVVAKAS